MVALFSEGECSGSGQEAVYSGHGYFEMHSHDGFMFREQRPYIEYKRMIKKGLRKYRLNPKRFNWYF